MERVKIFGSISMLAFILSFILSGCASTGYNTANHNGKLYYFPENCSHFRYSYSNPDELHCVGNDGKLTGRVLHPADAQQVANYKYQKEQEQKAWDSLNHSLDKLNSDLQKQNESLMQMMPKRYDVYHHYGY